MVKFASSVLVSLLSSRRRSSIQNYRYQRSAKWEMLMWISCVKLQAMSPKSRLCKADFANRTFLALLFKQQQKERQKRKSSTYPTVEQFLERDSELIERAKIQVWRSYLKVPSDNLAKSQVSLRMTNFLTKSTHDELTIQQFHSI